MLTMREVGPDGFGKKVRDWNRTEMLVGWRERWAELANERLAELGHDIRVDHRSHAAQGIELEPQNKIGPAGMRREARGEDAERAAEHEALARRNGERIIDDPSLVLAALTRQQSTFTRRDLARLVDRHTADAEQFAAAMAKVEASPELVRLGEDGRGQERFTTREMLATEQRMEQAAGTLAAAAGAPGEPAPAAGGDDHAGAGAGAGVPARDADAGSQRGGGLRRDRQEHDAGRGARRLGGGGLPGARRGAVGDRGRAAGGAARGSPAGRCTACCSSGSRAGRR